MKNKIFLLSRLLFLFICFDSSFMFLLADVVKRNNPFVGVEINVHKRMDKHIKIGALICALVETDADLSEIKIALHDQFPKPIHRSDKFLIVDSMYRMCPSVDSKKMIDMITLYDN